MTNTLMSLPIMGKSKTKNKAIYLHFFILLFIFRYSVISIEPKTVGETEELAKLRDHPQLDFWTEIGLKRPVNIMLTPMMKKSKIFKGFQTKTLIENVQDLIDNEKHNKPLVKSKGVMTWDDYYPYNEVCQIC